MRGPRMLIRWMLTVIVAVAVGVGSTPAEPAAAAVSITTTLLPEQPLAGVPASLLLRTWSSGAYGPNLTEPADLTGYPFRVSVYRAAEFAARYDRAEPLPIPLTQLSKTAWYAEIVFPEPGEWVIVFHNWHSLPEHNLYPPPGSRLYVEVRSTSPAAPVYPLTPDSLTPSTM